MIIVVYLLLAIASFAGGQLEILTEQTPDANLAFNSVEIGLAELSPRGEAGGYAVPASGCSAAGKCGGHNITTTCVNHTQVNATIGGDAMSRNTLYVNGAYRGDFRSSITVTLTHNTTYNIEIDFGPVNQERSGYISRFTITTQNCTPPGAIMGYKVNALNQAWNPAAVTVHGVGSYWQNPYNTGYIPAGWYTVSTTVPAGYEVSTSVNPGPASPWVPGASRVVYVPGGGIVHLWFKYTVANPTPIGYHDSASCTVIAGWACDASNYNAPIDVHVYADGNFLAAQRADNYRSDLPPVCGGNGYHGFSIPTPESLKDGQRHTIQVYGINTPAGNNPLLSNSSKSLTCSPPPPPTVSLRGRKDGGAWTASSFTVDPVSEADLTWSSANATDCDATAGPGFATGNAVSGTDTSITEPAAGNSSTYTVRCTGPGGSASDSIVITTNVGGVPTLEADPDYVRAGDDTTLTWNTNRNDPATCSLTGPGLTMGTLSAETGSTDTEINGESTFTLTCPGGEAEVTVEILPVVQET